MKSFLKTELTSSTFTRAKNLSYEGGIIIANLGTNNKQVFKH